MLFSYLTSSELTDVGRKRKQNEDSVLRVPACGVFGVADGMGGTAAGEVASAYAVKSVEDALAQVQDRRSIADRTVKRQAIENALAQASASIFQTAEEKGIGQSGTTVVVLVFDALAPSKAVALHAGDSRLYRFRKGHLKQLTKDHSFAQDAGYKNEKQVPEQFRGVVTRSIGIKQEISLEATEVDVAENDAFLLCSDGLTRMVPDRDLRGVLRENTKTGLDAVVRLLVDMANEAGGKDNISVVLIRVGKLLAAEVGDSDDDLDSPGANSESDTADTELTALTMFDGDTAEAHDDAPETSPAEPDVDALRRKAGRGRFSRVILVAAVTAGLISGVVALRQRLRADKIEKASVAAPDVSNNASVDDDGTASSTTQSLDRIESTDELPEPTTPPAGGVEQNRVLEPSPEKPIRPDESSAAATEQRASAVVAAAGALRKSIRTSAVFTPEWIYAAAADIDSLQERDLPPQELQRIRALAAERVVALAMAMRKLGTAAYQSTDMEQGDVILREMEHAIDAVPSTWDRAVLDGYLTALRQAKTDAAKRAQNARRALRDAVDALSTAEPGSWANGLSNLRALKKDTAGAALLPSDQAGRALGKSLVAYLRGAKSAAAHAQRFAEAQRVLEYKDLHLLVSDQWRVSLTGSMKEAGAAQDAWRRLNELLPRARQRDVEQWRTVLEAVARFGPASMQAYSWKRDCFDSVVAACIESMTTYLSDPSLANDTLDAATNMEALLKSPLAERVLPSSTLQSLRRLAGKRKLELLFEEALKSGRWGEFRVKMSDLSGTLHPVPHKTVAGEFSAWAKRWDDARGLCVRSKRCKEYAAALRYIEKTCSRDEIPVLVGDDPDWTLPENEWADEYCRLLCERELFLRDETEKRRGQLARWFDAFGPHPRNMIDAIRQIDGYSGSRHGARIVSSIAQARSELDEVSQWLDGVGRQPLSRRLLSRYPAGNLSSAEKRLGHAWSAMGEIIVGRMQSGTALKAGQRGSKTEPKQRADQIARLIHKLDFSNPPDIENEEMMILWTTLLRSLQQVEENAALTAVPGHD